jgi:pimeloyl-ACP methyl ester carboxylesterase
MFTRLLFLSLFLILVNLSFSKTTVYFFPGQGSDERLFSKIKLDSNFKSVYINYPVPGEGVSLAEYAKLLSSQIDTTEKYAFIGVSMGGMICSELCDYMKPEKVIIISSAKCSDELPFRYRFQKSFALNKIVPQDMIKWGAQFLQPIVEPDRNVDAETFKSMLASKNPEYYKRTVDMVLNWDKKNYDKKIIHIHGTNDHTIPFRNVKADYSLKDGSHMMTLTRGEEINEIIKGILVE